MTKPLQLFFATILALLLIWGLEGCGSAPPIAPATGVTNEQPWREMKSKMDAMTPEQRAQYIRAHPDEFANLGKIEAPPAPTTPK